MLIIDWISVYPAALDTVVQMPDLILFIHATRVTQIMAVRNAVWSLESRVGSNNLEPGSLYKRVADLEGGSSTDEKVKNTASDTTTGYLNDKIAAANGLAKATLSPGGNEQLQLSPTYGSAVNTVCQGNDSRLSDARTPTAHDLSGALHNSTTLANLNLKISDANLDDASSPRTDTGAFHKTTSAEISALATEKNPPVAGDWLVGEDSENANAKVKIQIGNLPGGTGTDTNAIHKTTAAEISALGTEKLVPVAGDWLIGEDSAAGNAKVKIQVGNLPGGTPSLPLTAAGDLLTRDGSTLIKIPIPPLNDLVLVSDTAEPSKMKWAQVPGHADAHTGPLEPWIREVKVTGDAANDQLGSAVAVSGNTVVTASAGVNGTHAVNIWIKEAGSWKFQQKLDYSADETISNTSGFGNNNVAVDGDTLLVGKYKYNSNRGNVDVWFRTNGVWALQTTLVAPDALSDRHFGNAVAIHGNTCAIAANYDDTSASDAGAVYVFTRSGITWSFQQKLIPADITSNDYFGWGVDVENDTLVASAYGVYKVYFYKRTGTTWAQTEQFVGNYGVSLSGNWAASGAANGFAKIYKRADEASAWSLHTTLANPEALIHGEPFNRFGTAVGIDGTTFIGGCWNRYEQIILPSGPLLDCGVAYSFKLENNVWVLKQKFKILPEDVSTPPYDHDPYKYEYGRSVAIDGGLIIIGEEFGTPVGGGIGNERGAFYAYNYYADIITVLEAAELERATTGAETPGATVSFDLTGAAPSGQGLANTPSGYRILVFREGVKMKYAASPATYMEYYYDSVNNEIDVLAPGSADSYQIVFF